MYAAYFLFGLFSINRFDVSGLVPFGFAFGTIAIHYASFFYSLYPIQRALAPWWLDPFMWVCHVVLLSVYTKVLLADSGRLPACDKNDKMQKEKADELIVQLAETGTVFVECYNWATYVCEW